MTAADIALARGGMETMAENFTVRFEERAEVF
jgi:hypothetical protein